MKVKRKGNNNSMSIKLHNFVFESTGISVSFRNVNPLVGIDIRQKMQKDRPKPPVEQLEVAGVLQDVPNEDDPDYVEALIAYENAVNSATNTAYIKRSKIMINYPGWQEEVNEYKQDVGDVPEESDEWLFLTRIAAGTTEELQSFYAALSATNQPSQEATQVARDSFQSTVS